MGQYLTIGLLTSIAIDKERARKESSATPEEVRDVMQKVYNQCGIYDLVEDDDRVYLKLKPEVANPEMAAFIEDFYRLRYGEAENEWKKAMDEIKNCRSLPEWLKLADERSVYLFQSDDFVWVATPFRREVWRHMLETRATQIMLSMDGKILMECFGSICGFFTRMIRERLSKYRLADALLVSISG